MIITPTFRLSTYLPLGVATIALGYAEASLFAEVGVFAVVVLVALVAIHQREHRLRGLTSGETNRLGICIAVAGVLWAGFRIVHEAKTGELASIGWVAFFVALVAPVLLALVCALLIKPGKKAGDLWFMQAAGLASIVLAGALAEDTLIVALTSIYALSAVWFLAEFHFARQEVELNAGHARVLRPMAWLAAVAAAAVPLQLLTPRSPFDKLEFGSGRIEIGYAAEQMVDLTQTGELQGNPETAFEVMATNANGTPKEDLDPGQRWRGAVLVTYAGGTWRRDTQTIFPTFPNTIVAPGPWSPPDLGPHAYRLEYLVPGKLRSRFLSDPVLWQPGEVVPVADLETPPQPWIAVNNGRVFGRSVPRSDDRVLRYVQFTRPPLEPDLAPPNVVTTEIPRMLIAYPVPMVRDYSDRVLSELVAAGRLPGDVQARDEAFLRIPERHHEKVARAFSSHLSEHADLKYTTNLKRVNKSVDPIEDFLLHSKAGHCERFATALVLMLRSQGIPAVMVLGFKGAEHVGNGKYLVRQEFAHAWAEVLIPRRDPDPRHRVYHWLGLDPSPVESQSAETDAAAGGWSLADFERFIFKSTPEQREQLLHSVLVIATNRYVLIGAGVAVASLLVRRVLRRRAKRKATQSGAAWFQALVAALQPYGVAPEPGETAAEFAARAACSLPVEYARLPEHWVGMHYRTQFGGVDVDPEHVADLEHQLQELARLPERPS